jgi:hypothetical protein
MLGRSLGESISDPKRLKVYVSCSLKTAAKTTKSLDTLSHVQTQHDNVDELEVFRPNRTISKYLEHLDIFKQNRYIRENLETLEVFRQNRNISKYLEYLAVFRHIFRRI